MVVTSTSVHKFNADKGLNRVQKNIWVFLNILNNNYFPNYSNSLCVREFCPSLDDLDWEKIYI